MKDKTYKIDHVTSAFDSNDYPGLIRATFDQMVNTEREKFIAEAAARKLEFVDQQDLAPLGVRCAFFAINGYPTAVRQVVVYDIENDSVMVRLDTQLLVPVQVAADV